MDIQVGDTLKMKKEHPCGSKEMLVLRVGADFKMKKEHPCGSKEMLVLRIGADFKLKCTGCGREFMTPRSKCEKKIKSVIRNAVEEEK